MRVLWVIIVLEVQRLHCCVNRERGRMRQCDGNVKNVSKGITVTEKTARFRTTLTTHVQTDSTVQTERATPPNTDV